MAGLWERIKPTATDRVEERIFSAALWLYAQNIFIEDEVIDALNSDLTTALTTAEEGDVLSILNVMDDVTDKEAYAHRVSSAFVLAEKGVVDEATWRDLLIGGFMPDIRVSCIRATLPFSGTKDFTDATLFGGTTPKAAAIIVTRALTDGTAALDASLFSFGATDGTRQWCVSGLDKGGVATMLAKRRYSNAQIVAGYDSAGTGASCDFTGSLVADGLRLTTVTTPAAAYLATVILFGGADLEARCDTLGGGSTTSTQTYSSMGFGGDGKFNAMFSGGHGGVADSGGTVLGTQITAMGFAGWDGATLTQVASQHIAVDAAADADLRQIVDSARVLRTGSADAMQLLTVTSSGFTWKTANAVTDGWSWLALRTPGARCKALIADSPVAATGSPWTYAGLPWKPAAVFALPTRCSAIDSSETDDDAGTFAFGCCDKQLQQFSNAISGDDAAATSDTISLASSKFIHTYESNSNANDHQDTITAFTGTGWTATSSVAADTTVRKWPVLAIEDPLAGVSQFIGSGFSGMTGE